jgi:hypothetical protein
MPMQAEVWKREQEKAHEERKLEEMKKEIAEERKMQELTDQAAEAGHVQKVERLEFMYKGGPGMGGPGMGMGVPSEDTDAYLLGEKKFEAPKGGDALDAARDKPGSLLAQNPEMAKNETWNKLNSDPLLTMRVQEQEARRAITTNPAEMARVRAELERKRREKKEKKRRKKEEKKAAKRARKERIRAEVRREVLGEDVEYAAGSVRRRDASRRGDEGKKKKRRRDDRRGSSTSSSDSESSSDSDSRPKRGKRARSRSRSTSRDARRPSSRDGRERERRREASRREDDRRDRRDRSRSPRSRSPRPARLAARDGATAQDGSSGYGLTYANERGEHAARVRRERRDEWREHTRGEREAEEEARRREAREKEARWANKKRGSRNTVGHETGKLSEAERLARLAAMSSDAEKRDSLRVSKLREDTANRGEKSLGELAASAPERHHSEAAPFLEKAQKEAFSVGGKGGLEDRIGATKYYKQRGGGDD